MSGTVAYTPLSCKISHGPLQYLFKEMNIKQISEFETGFKNKQAKKADEDQQLLIKKNHNKKRVFIFGNYNSGTRWLNYLIIKNTPPDYLYALRNQHKYLNDNNSIQNQFKHGILNEKILNQKNLLIIYIIRDFDTFLPSFLNNSYDKKIKNGIIAGENMNVYEWYCHMIKSNITLLRNSASNYIIVNMRQVQKDKGKTLLNTLEMHGFKFIKPHKFIDKHTKTKQKNIINKNYKWTNLMMEICGLHQTPEFDRNNKEIENIIKTIAIQPEIKVSWN